MKPLPVHPLANLLPSMSEAEYGALRDNIRSVGKLIEPIILLDGKILDGRHRDRVCCELDIARSTKPFDPAWGSPVSYVYSKAVHRNLGDSQKAAAAVLIEEEFAKDAAARSKANLKQNGRGGKSATSDGTFTFDKSAKREGKTRMEFLAKWNQMTSENLAKEYSARVGRAGKDPGRSEMVQAMLDRIFGPSAYHAGIIGTSHNFPKLAADPHAARDVEGMSRADWEKTLGKLKLPDLIRLYRKHCLGGSKVPVSGAMTEDAARNLILDKLFPTVASTNGKSRDLAAGLFGVSGRYVQEAKLVRKQDRKLFEQVFSGVLTLPRARSEIRRSVKRDVLAKAAKSPAAQAARGEILTGDNLAMMPALKRKSFRLVFADPPYNEGLDYGDGPKADKLPEAEFLTYTRQWMAECVELLTPDGTMMVLINDEWADHFGLILRSLGLTRRAWLKWYESFGVNNANGFNRCSRHLFYCVRDARQFIFNAEVFRRPSDRQAKYADPRANPAGKIWDDVWGINPPIPRLVGNAAERMPDGETQLPLSLLRPIVAGFSEPGDHVLDPFSGSGTTVAACNELGRYGTGIERNEQRAEQSRLRLKGGL